MRPRLQSGDQVYWWKRTSSTTEHPFLAKVISIGAKRIKIAIDDESDLANRIIRHVSRSRIQQIAKYFAKASGQGPAILSPADSWGKFVRFLEVGDDLRAVRQIDFFRNGNMLSYDRHHWVDEFGELGAARLNRNRKYGTWGRSHEIPRAEFERIWKRARCSKTWERQRAAAQMDRFGTIPVWLTIRSWRPPL